MSEESSGVLQGKGSSQWDCWRDEGVTDSGAAGMLRTWSRISSSTIQDQYLLFKLYLPLCPKGQGLVVNKVLVLG